MRRHLPAILVLLSLAPATNTFAQSGEEPFTPVTRIAAAAAGRVQGVVTDQAGATIRGASVLAMGSALAMARTDWLGRFSLVLPPGEYILRATHDGYISTYREPVRIHSDMELRRSITLTRVDEPGAQPAGSAAASEQPEPDHAHSEMAWRLRHLSRTVLRDGAGAGPYGNVVEFDEATVSMPMLTRGADLFEDAGLNGQVNLMTTSALASAGGMVPQWPRGVAHVVIGAPVGAYGDWSVRAAMAGGELPAWTLLGEFRTRDDGPHVVRTGVSFSSQAHATSPGPWLSIETPGDSRRVGGVYGYDRWTIAPAVTFEYGLKVDRYDYLAEPALVSARVGARVGILPRVTITASLSPHMIAPGADQFLPPASTGPWLPPERTFSALTDQMALRPERIERHDIGVEVDLGDSRVLTVGRFSEASRDQIATLFGLDRASQIGHYYVASPGNVHVEGWVLGLAGALNQYVNGSILYAFSQAGWTGRGAWGALRSAAPSAARTGFESTHDLVASVEATLPITATRVAAAYRVNNAFSAAAADRLDPVVDGRFNIELRQHLPFQPFRHGELNLLVAARTLLRDFDANGAFYDELLTVAPPLRLTCGLQMRF